MTRGQRFRRLVRPPSLSREDALTDSVADIERLLSVWTTMAWIAGVQVPTEPLVSVIMATRNRAERLPDAIASVLEQSHPTIELVVVDDGSDDSTPDVLDEISDPRLRVLRIEQAGVAAARNHGLAAARGSVIAYLDDDNCMHPDWLRSVVWAFSRWPDVEVLFGARIVEDSQPHRDIPHEMPIMLFEPFDRHKLETELNTIDVNVLAHRAGLAGDRFDETLTGCADWDMVLRLTEPSPPLALPVLAVFYGTSAPARLSSLPTFWEEAASIRSRADDAS